MVSDKDPGPSALRKRVSTKTESSEASIQHVGIGTWGRLRGRVPELCHCGRLNRFYRVFLPGFLWPVIFIYRAHSPYLVYLRILPHERRHLLAKLDSTKEAVGAWH